MSEAVDAPGPAVAVAVHGRVGQGDGAQVAEPVPPPGELPGGGQRLAGVVAVVEEVGVEASERPGGRPVRRSPSARRGGPGRAPGRSRSRRERRPPPSQPATPSPAGPSMPGRRRGDGWSTATSRRISGWGQASPSTAWMQACTVRPARSGDADRHAADVDGTGVGPGGGGIDEQTVGARRRASGAGRARSPVAVVRAAPLVKRASKPGRGSGKWRRAPVASRTATARGSMFAGDEQVDVAEAAAAGARVDEAGEHRALEGDGRDPVLGRAG